MTLNPPLRYTSVVVCCIFVLIGVGCAIDAGEQLVKVSTWVDATKQRAGSIRQLVAGGKAVEAIRQVDAVIKEAQVLKDLLQGVSSGSISGKDDAEKLDFDTGAEFNVSTTYKPRQCTRKAVPGHRLRVHYVGKLLATGKAFASSFHTGSVPHKIVLGSDDELEGWNRGLVGMCPDERRKLVLPWNMAYGEAGNGKLGVPARADVVFFMELVSVSERPARGFEHLVPADGSRPVDPSHDEF